MWEEALGGGICISAGNALSVSLCLSAAISVAAPVGTCGLFHEDGVERPSSSVYERREPEGRDESAVGSNLGLEVCVVLKARGAYARACSCLFSAVARSTWAQTLKR